MIKNTILGLTFLLTSGALFAQKLPEQVKTEFDEAALSQELQDLDGNVLTVADVLKKHEGKVVFLYLWASWCPDCITGFPGLKKTQKNYPDTDYVFFSLDRVGKEQNWKNSIQKYELTGEHYWFNTEWKNSFTQNIDLNWIPRYMIIDQTGKIVHYYAIHADSPEMINVLEKTLKK